MRRRTLLLNTNNLEVTPADTQWIDEVGMAVEYTIKTKGRWMVR
jgi:hypothetical protein